MRVLYATRSAGHFCYVAPTVMPLSAAGHRVDMLFDRRLAKGFEGPGELGRLCRAEGQSANCMIRRSLPSRYLVEASRNLLTYSAYLSRTDQSDYYRRRWEQYLIAPIRALLPLPGVRSRVARASVQRALRRFEERTAPDPRILDHVRALAPDVLVASPLNYWQSEEVEYVKAAKALGIPTALHVFSWDNLTTKALLYVVPDLVLVWNERQVREAMDIHAVPRERILITGAPHFDELFEPVRPPLSRKDFCAKAELDPDRPYLVYLGSSSFVASDETWLVREIAASLAQHNNPEVRAMQILLRPHPAHSHIYEAMEDDRLRVWPKGGGKLASESFMPDFRDTLEHAVAAFGINTSGLFNAVIVDRPCLTVLAPRYRETQAEAAHFQHLLEADVLETCGSAAELADRLERIGDGEDLKAGQRRSFVEGWIRPRGIKHPAGEWVARAIELLERGLDATSIEAMLDGPRPLADAEPHAS
jgi:hypothetical protein